MGPCPEHSVTRVHVQWSADCRQQPTQYIAEDTPPSLENTPASLEDTPPSLEGTSAGLEGTSVGKMEVQSIIQTLESAKKSYCLA